MRRAFFKWSILCGMCASSSYAAVDQELKEESLKDEKKIYSNNPLQGFSTFVFSARFPATKDVADKVNVVVKNTLSSFGKVVPSSMLVQTDKGEAIDLSGFTSGAFLTYEIIDLSSLDGKKLGLLKATLSLQAGAEIERTKVECTLDLWQQSCFLKGDTEKDLARTVSRSLQYLMQVFLKDYSIKNTDTPTFNLYQS